MDVESITQMYLVTDDGERIDMYPDGQGGWASHKTPRTYFIVSAQAVLKDGTVVELPLEIFKSHVQTQVH